jgi:hypothetical protein
MTLHLFLDNIPLAWYLAVILAVMLAFIELGFWLGRRHTLKSYKPQMAQVRAIMGASLGLVAFMLAFGFGMGQAHFEARTQAYVLEVNAVKSAYLTADLLSDGNRADARRLLHDFAANRVRTQDEVQAGDVDEAWALILESETMHDALWNLALDENARYPESAGYERFSQAVLDMMVAHNERLEATIYNRIAPIIWVTLFVMAILAMVVMGYQGGLTGTRSRVATWTLAFTFSAVMTLITDLDRPRMALFSMNDQILADLKDHMERDLAREAAQS